MANVLSQVEENSSQTKRVTPRRGRENAVNSRCITISNAKLIRQPDEADGKVLATIKLSVHLRNGGLPQN